MAALLPGAQNKAPQSYAKVGDAAWAKMEKINADLLTLTYGAIVAQIVREHGPAGGAEVTAQLEKLGYGIGGRLVDEFFARTGLPRCRDLRETAEAIARTALRMYLGVQANVIKYDAKKQSFRITLEENPLCEFVEVPPELAGSIEYSAILCGAIRGALEQVQMKVVCRLKKEPTRGDPLTEIKVTLVEVLRAELPVGDE